MSDNNDPWFTAAKSEIDAGQAAQIRNNLQFSLDANPQKEAGIRQLYNATGIPLASIRDNEQDVRTAATLKQFDAHGLVQSTPATARLLTDPDNTRLLHDAIPNTMAVEKATAEPPVTTGQALKRGLLGFSSWLGDSGTELGHGAAEWINKAAGAVNIVVGGVPVIFDKVAGTNTSQWWFDKMIKPTADRADNYALKPDASFNQKLMHGIGGFGPMMAAVIGSGGTAAAPEGAALASEGVSALPALGNAVGHAIKAMWFPAVTDAVNTGNKVYEATGDGHKALVAAGAQYTATTGMGLVPLSVTGGWATRAASGFVGQVAAGEGSRELMNAAMPDSMHTDFNWEDAFVNGTIGSLMGVTLGPRSNGYSMEPVRQTYLDAAKSDAAVADYNRLNVVSKMSSASALRERDPALFKRFVSEVTEAQDVPDLYIDAHQLDRAFERASVTPDDLARTMPELAAQLLEARMANGLVKIPMADYATHIAGTEIDAQILPHVRTDPEGMTYQEGQVFHQTQVEQMQAAVSKVVAGRVDDAQRRLSVQVVHNDVKQQLDSTGRVGADVADDYAALHAAFFDSMASKMGVAPDEAYRQLGGARIVADAAKPDTTQLYQSARDSIQEAIGKAKDDKRYNTAHDIMPAAPEAIDEAAQHGMDITGFTHVIDGSAIRHVLKAHGNEAKELARGNLPISEADFNAIPDIIAAPDATVYGLKNDIGRDMIGYLKKMPDGSTLYLEEVRTGRKKLAMQSMRRYPQTTDATSILKSLRPTSEALPGNSAEVSVIEHPALRNSAPDSLAQGERGAYDPATRTLTLLKDADLSTFLHESGHFFLDTYARTVAGAGAPDAVKADFDTLLKSFGVAGETPEARAAGWAGRDLNAQRDGHEQFARGFEQYLMDGKAPNAEMAGVFARFRSWLLSVYKTVSGLRADLAPEVREVMDRMLASEETIKNAESARGYDPLFDSAERAGMTKAEWDEYLSLGSLATQHAVDELQARSISDLKWAAEVKGNTIKAMQEDAALRRAEMREKVVREIDKEPVERVRNSLKNGLMVDADGRPVDGAAARDGANLKLSKPAIREMYPHDMPNRPDIDRLTPYSDADGFHPDFLADMFGYPSGRELVDDLLHAGDRDAKVEAITDQRMLERYGDLTSPEAIEQAAELAIHNEMRARMIATELKVAAKVEGSPTSISRAAKQIAERTVEQKSVGELRPGMYTAAEARAARAAMKALSVNDLAAVGEEKRVQLLNNRLAKVTQDVIFEMEAGQRYLKKFSKASVAKSIGADYMDRILGILSQFDLAAREPGADVPLRDWMQAEFERTGVMPAVSDSLIGRQQRWSTLSVADFRELVTSIKSLEHIGREQTTLILDGKKVALDDLVAEATQSMSTLPHADPVDLQPHLKHAGGLDKISTKFLNLKSKIRSGDAALLKMEQLFQWLDAGDRAGLADGTTGAFSKIFKSMASAEGMERSMRAESAGELRALGEKLRESGIKLNDALVVGLPRKGRGTHWYREELLAAALNVGNESNMRKLTQGYEWEEAQVLRELDRHLSAPEWDFVQGVWNAIGKYGPQIEALQKRQTGVAPMMIEPRTVTTRHGDYTGGYFPVVFDAFLDRNAETKQARQADMLFENQWAKPSTSKGHTVERTGYVGPLQLSLGVITRHLDQVTHDLAWREPITDANKFLNDPRIKSEIDQTFGKEYTAQLRPWLQAMANDKVFNTSGDSAWESFYRKARSNVSIMGLGYRLSTMQIHGLSALSTSIGEVGVKWMAQGVAQFSGIDRMAKARDFVFDRSPEMLNRSNEFDRNVAEAINEINAHESAFKSVSAAQKAVDGAKKFAFYGVAMLDMASAMPTWYGAYLKGMATESKGGLNLSEEAAIEYANRAVRNAHGGGGTKDLAAIQRDKGAMSMATMFYSFWNHMYNRQRDLVKGYSNLPDSVAQGRGTKDFARLLARSWWYFVVPQVIHAALHPQKNDDGDLSASLLHMAEEVALGAISGVPVLRDLANAAVNGRAYTVTPLESAGKALVATASDASKVAHGEPAPPHMAKNAIQSAGYVYGLPLGQASNTGQFLWDVVDGTQQPQDMADWWRGISHGDMKKH